MCDNNAKSALPLGGATYGNAGSAPSSESASVPLVVRELRQRRAVLLQREFENCRQLETVNTLLHALEG